jgi:hypothetical protein
MKWRLALAAAFALFALSLAEAYSEMLTGRPLWLP